MSSKTINFGNLSKLNGNFSFSYNNRFYLKFISLPFGLNKKYINLIGNDENAIILNESFTIDEGSLEWGSVRIAPGLTIEYPISAVPPKNLNISFIDSDDDRIYKIIHSWVENLPTNQFVGIHPKNLHNYSGEIQIYRYDLKNEKGYYRNFTVIPREKPKFAGSAEGALKVYSVDFYIVDWENSKYFQNLLQKNNIKEI